MKKFIVFTMTFVSLLMMGGCNDDSLKPHWYDPTSNTGGSEQTQPSDQSASQQGPSQNSSDKTNTQQTEEGNTVAFDLPTGWKRDDAGSSNRGIQWSPSSDGVKPYVLVEVWGSKGTKEEARQLAQKDHSDRMQYCSDEACAKWITYSEQTISGIDVFVSTDVNAYWGAESLSSEVWFEKEGELYQMSIDDPVGAHLDEVKKIIETVHVVNP